MRPSHILALPLLLLPLTLRATTRNVPSTQYPTIQSAINASASSGDTIQVAAGTYTENLDFLGKGLSLLGAGKASTTIDGSGAGPVVYIHDTTSDALVDGFTLQNGGKPQTTGGPYGAAFLSNAPAASVASNTITKAFCAGVVVSNSSGGFVSTNEINSTLTTGCPSAEGLGSGVVVINSASVEIHNNTIDNNTASASYPADKGGGGAINITASNNIGIVENILRYNTTTGYGGAMYVATTPSIYFEGNLVYGNKGISGGLDIVVPGSSVGPIAGLIVSNTIADNTATSSGAGSDIYIGGNLAQYAVVNNIIVGYISGQSSFNCGTAYSSQTLTPLIIANNDFVVYPSSGATAVGGACTSPAGTFGNISVDPQFTLATPASVTGLTADFHLTSGSPAIDTGNNDVDGNLSTDLDGNTRIQDGTGLGYRIIDLGAYEFPGITTTSVTSILLTPSTYVPTTGSTLTLTATLTSSTGSPTGSVNFYEDGTLIGTSVITSAAATLQSPALTAGLHTFYATYPGQGAYGPATSIPFYIRVGAGVTATTTLTLTSSINPSNAGQPVTFSANISSASGTPTGQIEFSDGSTTLGIVAVDTSGNAVLPPISTLAVGSHTITAAYVPTGSFAGTSIAITQIVTGATAIATLTVTPTTGTYGTPFVANVTVAPSTLPGTTPTGTITFALDGATSGAATLSGGTASVTYPSLPAGTHTLTCTYSGDAIYATAPCNTVTITVTANTSTLTLASSINPSPAFSPITFTLHLTSGTQPAPANNVTLTYNPTGTAPIVVPLLTDNSGNATYTLTTGLAPGSYLFTANFAATASLSASTASLTEVVNPISTTTSLTASPNPGYQGQTITLTATVASTASVSATGTVNFYDATTFLGIATLNASGIATLTTTLAVGTHPLTATYAGSSSFLGSSTTTSYPEVILPSAFTLTLSPSTITLPPGQQGNITLQLASVGAFAGPLTLAYGTLPQYASATLAPTSVLLTAGSTATSTLTLKTTALAANDIPTRPGTQPRNLIAFATLLILFPFTLRNRRRLPTILTLLLAAAALQSLTGCTEAYEVLAHVAPGTYQIPITATDANSNQQTATLTVVVTP